jgi:Carbohydrate-selective porin, OprB family/S-layer homology domain
MSKFLFKSLLAAPAVVGTALALSTGAIAAESKVASEAIAQPEVLAQPEIAPVVAAPVAPVVLAQAAPADASSLDQVNRYSREGRGTTVMSQVTSVSQLSDVKPTDWAFQALQSLVERYGCIVGYPDKTFRGNRAMTRYEFAAGLNACMDRVNELIAASTADLVKKEDLETLKKLQEEFAAELATLRGRVDALEARTATLEKQQFSTTTKLAGEVIFAITDELGQPRDNNPVFQDRVRLALNTSFTGKDLLVTRLAAGNANTFDLGGSLGTAGEGFQTFNYGNTGGNSVFADWVAYYFPMGEKTKFYLAAINGLHYDYAPTNSGPQEAYDGGTGALSVFASRNPIYSIGGGAGLGVNFDFSKSVSLSLGYLANNANNPTSGNGLFDGSYSALAQVTFKASDKLSVGLTYVNAFRNNGNGIFDGGGSGRGTLVGTLHSNLSTLGGSAEVNAFGLSAAYKFSPSLVVNGWFTYATADYNLNDEANIFSYGLGLGLPDFGKKGNLLGLIVGAEPYVSNPNQVGIAAPLNTKDIPLHIEGFYKYQLTDNISITPGVIWVINPGQNDNNDDVIIGTVRTTFTF